jgi:hypothetical protein
MWTLVVQDQRIALRVSHFSLSLAIKIRAGKPLAMNSYKPTFVSTNPTGELITVAIPSKISREQT